VGTSYFTASESINEILTIFDMEKSVNYLVVAMMVLSSVLISCNDDNKRPNDNECICILTDEAGVNMGGDAISDEMLEVLNFMMYPNPTYGVVTLYFKTADLHIVTITDKRGEVLFDLSFEGQTITLDVSKLSAGKYRVTANNGEQKSTLCLIKN